ncbi:hypothetical protein Vretifemale_15584 [Volvox reticuliferus]|uniref:Uncharacterized protein n=1 Tax=Volvox reticuliferus TaxID=1737510 RepID=A0A8J4CS55_9CHLO|nr:hypothetical protein Vretifemale_15584 [Volvox reticuliferus]
MIQLQGFYYIQSGRICCTVREKLGRAFFSGFRAAAAAAFSANPSPPFSPPPLEKLLKHFPSQPFPFPPPPLPPLTHPPPLLQLQHSPFRVPDLYFPSCQVLPSS